MRLTTLGPRTKGLTNARTQGADPRGPLASERKRGLGRLRNSMMGREQGRWAGVGAQERWTEEYFGPDTVSYFPFLIFLFATFPVPNSNQLPSLNSIFFVANIPSH
jgi:hypothetical protein